MQTNVPYITPQLVFESHAEEAVYFYTSVFPNSSVLNVVRFGPDQPGPEGTICAIACQLNGQEFVAVNGGPTFQFSYGISLYVSCETQAEIDHLWEHLAEGGEHQPCGWLKDRFGVSWQIAPRVLGEMMKDPDPKKTQRVMQAVFGMTKLDLAAIERAYVGSLIPEP
jgi:predicted 3-demethylubiquinone-9 3-methyltransferase (glyoxalase superfamily)